MTVMHCRLKLAEFNSELESGGDAVRDLVWNTLQEILEEEMMEALGAAKSERTSDRPAGVSFQLLQASFDDAGRPD